MPTLSMYAQVLRDDGIIRPTQTLCVEHHMEAVITLEYRYLHLSPSLNIHAE